jgi:hypothetical protein
MSTAGNLNGLNERISAKQINRQRLGKAGTKSILRLASKPQQAEMRECLALGHGAFYNGLFGSTIQRVI